MAPMKVDVSIELDCSAAKVWNEVQKECSPSTRHLAARAHQHVRFAGFTGTVARGETRAAIAKLPRASVEGGSRSPPASQA